MISQIDTIDARLLRVFVEVARRRGITAAGEALGQPKSSVSKALTRLEHVLGARLLERSTRRVALSPAGEALLGRAESILAELDRLVEDVHAQTDSVHGIVRVTAPPELGALLARRFFPVVLGANPGLALAVELGYRFEDLFDPRFDVAFRVGSFQDDRLVARKLGSFTRVLVASPAYLARRPVRAVEDLAHCNCLAFSGIERTATWTLERRPPGQGAALLPAQSVPIRGSLAMHGFASLQAAAEAGLGVARLPDFVAADAIASGALARVLPDWSCTPSEVFLVHRFGHERIKRVGALVAAALEQVGRLLDATRQCR
jgi:DNA-binding transcriptional LysR family regulator